MPFNWNDHYIESKAKKNTDVLGFGEIGGIGQLIYHIFRYKDYELRYDNSDEQLAWPVCKPGFEPDLSADGAYTGRDLLASLCNLAKKIDDFSEKKSYTDLIIEWCKENAHPYSIDFIYNGLTDKGFDITTYGDIFARDGVFSISDFMRDLGNLYNAARFYVALDGVCLGDDEAARNLYSEGRHFEGDPFFEEFKLDFDQPEIDYSSAGGDLLKEMQLDSAFRAANSAKKADEPGAFVREPYDHYEELRNRLIEAIPDFKMRLKVNPTTNRLIFSADVESVFDICWYTLARMLSEDPAPEEKGKDDDRLEGIMICCHNCGDFFIRRNSRQEYCDKDECQRARNAKNQKNYRDRKRIEKAQQNKAD